jgi:hypothetical protein
MDRIGWYIATLHSLVGHNTAARYLGQPAGDRSECIICRYEQHPTSESRQAVIDALSPRPAQGEPCT